ncbi:MULTISPECIES: flagellar motor stator protein MotA [unclassified Pelosinus]|uniref:flagellar motor stator protein MotA n=1 Tax=unclassified Pelosinus TaxID=2629460 RepID=UPI0004D1C635|nr:MULTISPECIES: flagellar motor stator protein MotA [unclassified Pelosinus]AIF50807.1 MotA/TolQ/ExbB proton channel [Pelosinus sp. UFO1]GMA97789.1 flagellar motor protein MotA [Pelosinus sp. IPA-1]
MELSTVLGVVVGFVAVGVGMVLKGANLAVLINPAAFLIILAGTAACLLNAFPMEILQKFPTLIKMLFKKPEFMSKVDMLKMFVELSQTARREGILALESRVDEVPDVFLKTGLSMVIDGLDPDFVGDVLEAEIQGMEERHRVGALIFSQAGSYAPTLGVLGAVVGLIAALGNLNDIDALGHSIAAAFVATLLGIFTGYVIWHPFSNKLKMMSKKEVEIRKMMVEGILSLQAGDSPTAIEAKLTVFISQTERNQMKAKTEEA